MPNKLITVDEAAQGILDSINNAVERYQKDSGCPEKEAKELASEIVNNIRHGLFYGSKKQRERL